MVVPVGSTLWVYWSGADDWYKARVIAHQAIFDQDGTTALHFHHKLEYDNGACSHDLGTTDYEVIELAPQPELPVGVDYGGHHLRPRGAAAGGVAPLDLRSRQDALEHAQLDDVMLEDAGGLSARVREKPAGGGAQGEAGKAKRRGGIAKAVKRVAKRLRGGVSKRKRITALAK